MSTQKIPEMALVSSHEEDSMYARNLAGKLLEHQIRFTGRTEQTFLKNLPENLDEYKALLIDDRIFFRICKEKSTDATRLERFAKEKTFYVLTHTCDSYSENRILCFNILETQLPSFIAMSGLECGDFSKGMAGPEFGSILEEMTEYLISFMKEHIPISQGHYSELHLHTLKPAQMLLSLAPDNEKLRSIFIDTAKFCNGGKSIQNHDQAGALFAAVELRDMTGESAPAETMIKLIDEMLSRRPRTPDGIITGKGFTDDPLYINRINNCEHWTNSATTAWRNSIWTEILHFYGPSLGAAYRYSGNKKYLNEIMSLIKYIDQYHRDNDGLLFHVTLNSKVISSKWGRGIAHALYGIFYLLQELRNNEPEKVYIETFIRKTFDGILKYQCRNSGLWHNIIDKTYSPLETSCSVCFTTIAAASVNIGILDKEKFVPMIRNALNGLRKMYWRGGFAGNCIGTGTSPNNEIYYLKRPFAWQVMPQLIIGLLEAKKAGIIEL